MAVPNDTNLKVVSYNCRGISSSLQDIQQLCDNYQVIFLQETWLAKQNLDRLTTISEQHYSYGTYSVDYEDGLCAGRPHGGTAILWSKTLSTKIIKNHDQSVIGIEVDLGSTSICLINVYMPYCCSSNIDDYLDHLGKLTTMLHEQECPNMCMLGDFNAGTTNMFGQLLSSFCKDNDFTVSDQILLPADSFTYISDAHGSTSWIDHCISSNSAHQAIAHIKVLHDFIISDHRPLAITFACSTLPQLQVDRHLQPALQNINWKNLSHQQKETYSIETRNCLAQLYIPPDVADCNNLNAPTRLIFGKLILYTER